MITKAITNHSLVLVDQHDKVLINDVKKGVKVWEIGFDVRSDTLKLVNATQAKKLKIDLCEAKEIAGDSGVFEPGALIAQSKLDIFERAMVCGDIDDTRFYVNGCALLVEDQKLVSTDACILFESPLEIHSERDVIVPNVLLKLMIKVSGKKSMAYFSSDGDYVTIDCNGFRGQARIIHGKYPPYKTAIPQAVTNDFFIEDIEMAVKEKKVKSEKGTFYYAPSVEKIKKMGFGPEFYIENVHRPALFKDKNGCQALLVPSKS